MKIVLIVIVGTFVLIGLVAYFLIGRLRKQAWEGELIDKQETTSSAGEFDSTNYMLIVKTTAGEKKRCYVNRKYYQQFSIGDKLVKKKGETFPKKAI